jgi:glycosyltransferase involved in cell wall biosynthesis
MVVYTTYATDPRVRREAEALASLPGYNVTVVVPKATDLPSATELNGVRVTELNARRYWGNSFFAYLLSYLKFLFAAFWDCSRLALCGKIDVVHVHNMPNFLVFAALLPRLLGKKIILDIHDSVPETYIEKFKNKSPLVFKLLCLEEAICCSMAHRIICVNHPQCDVLVNRGIPAHKISISLNVPDDRWFNGATAGREIRADGTFNLVYHGTLARRLGVDLTIRALSKLSDQIPGLRFHIVGAGESLEELVSLTEDLGLSSKVIFHGLLPIEGLASFLRDMHLGVISNRSNIATELMLPVKMLEYVSLNIPVVAPPLKTIRYYFTDEMLSYFDSENVDSLSSAILDAYSNEEKRLRRAKEAKTFLDRYGWARHKEDFIGLYASLTR